VAASVNKLALVYYCEGNYDAAEPLYRRAIEIREKNLGPKDPAVLQTMEYYAALLRQQGRKKDAQNVEAQVTSATVSNF
jgi:tetratricopeptide (TPR) repeat protein